MKVKIYAPVPIFLESRDGRFYLGLSLEGLEVAAGVDLKTGVAWVRTPCAAPSAQAEIGLAVERTVVKPGLELKSACLAERAVAKLLSNLQKEDRVMDLDDLAEILTFEEQLLLRASHIGGLTLLYASKEGSATLPISQLPPPPRLQVLVAQSDEQAEAKSVGLPLEALVDVMGIASATWKEDMLAIDEFLKNISLHLNGTPDYVSRPPFLPVLGESLKISLVPRAELGCPAKLLKYRDALRKIAESSPAVGLFSISPGVRLEVEEEGRPP